MCGQIGVDWTGMGREGDTVVVVPGLPAPCILRPVASEPGYYEWVGGTWVENMMYGAVPSFVVQEESSP